MFFRKVVASILMMALFLCWTTIVFASAFIMMTLVSSFITKNQQSHTGPAPRNPKHSNSIVSPVETSFSPSVTQSLYFPSTSLSPSPSRSPTPFHLANKEQNEKMIITASPFSNTHIAESFNSEEEEEGKKESRNYPSAPPPNLNMNVNFTPSPRQQKDSSSLFKTMLGIMLSVLVCISVVALVFSTVTWALKDDLPGLDDAEMDATVRTVSTVNEEDLVEIF